MHTSDLKNFALNYLLANYKIGEDIDFEIENSFFPTGTSPDKQEEAFESLKRAGLIEFHSVGSHEVGLLEATITLLPKAKNVR